MDSSLTISVGHLRPDWSAIEAVSTAVLAATTLISLPALILQLWLSRRLHAEDVVERGSLKIAEIRKTIRMLNVRKMMIEPVTSDDIGGLRSATSDLNSAFATLELSFKLGSARNTKRFLSEFISDSNMIVDIIRYFLEDVSKRSKKFGEDSTRYILSNLSEIGADAEDVESMREFLTHGEGGQESYSALLEAIFDRILVKKGASAKFLAERKKELSSKTANYRDADIASEFQRHGGDFANRLTLNLWLNELDEMLNDMVSLVSMASKLAGGNRAQS